jgi:hypothetical protein
MLCLDRAASASIADHEVSRVSAHIVGAERLARHSSGRLDPLRRLSRALLLQELRRYRRARRFPNNQEFPNKLVPYFIDADGTRCAVAHLLEVAGRSDIVQKIARQRNNARVRELANERELLAWLNAAGISLAEAARIQPSYCFTPASDCFCIGLSSNTVALATVITTGSPGLVRIDDVQGAPADLVVGQEYGVTVSAPAGSQVLLADFPNYGNNDGGFHFSQVQVVSQGTVTCTQGDFAKSHPVPVDVVERALLAQDVQSCVDTLGALDPGWSKSSCSGGCGCANVGHVTNSIPAVTTGAIILAILCYQLRRRSARG